MTDAELPEFMTRGMVPAAAVPPAAKPSRRPPRVPCGQPTAAGKRLRALSRFVDGEAFVLLSEVELKTWLVLFRCAGRGGVAKRAHADIARRIGRTTGGVKKAVNRLCELGLLTKLRRGTKHRGPSVYKVRSRATPVAVE